MHDGNEQSWQNVIWHLGLMLLAKNTKVGIRRQDMKILSRYDSLTGYGVVSERLGPKNLYIKADEEIR